MDANVSAGVLEMSGWSIFPTRRFLRKHNPPPGLTPRAALNPLPPPLALLACSLPPPCPPQILQECEIPEERFFIHCDGALFGMMLPFIKDAPMVTFEKPIGSVSVSGHKFVGVPMPCGVVITRMRHVRKLSSDIEYLNSRDATIMGSRNGHAPIFMWHTLTRKGYEGMRKDVEKCLRNAVLLRAMLERAGVKVLLNELSSTVVFERPAEEAFVKKWQLACEGDIAHVIVMPNVTLPKLEQFAMEYIQSRARSAAVAAKEVASACYEPRTPVGSGALRGSLMRVWTGEKIACAEDSYAEDS